MSVLRIALAGIPLASCLLACARVESPAVATTAAPQASESPPAGAAQVVAIAPAIAASAASSRVYIDPVTGEERAPTPAELAAESAAQKSGATAAIKVAPEVKVTRLPNGMTEYDFGKSAKVQETACLQKDGTLGECSAVQIAELRKQSRKPASR
jgi:hypothetical protein